MRSIPSSMRIARRRLSVSSPVLGRPVSMAPTPTARIARPPESWSTVATWLATFHGRRHGNGVSSVPRRIRCVRAAIAASKLHAVGRLTDEHSVPPGLFGENGLLQLLGGWSPGQYETSQHAFVLPGACDIVAGHRRPGGYGQP